MTTTEELAKSYAQRIELAEFKFREAEKILAEIERLVDVEKNQPISKDTKLSILYKFAAIFATEHILLKSADERNYLQLILYMSSRIKPKGRYNVVLAFEEFEGLISYALENRIFIETNDEMKILKFIDVLKNDFEIIENPETFKYNVTIYIGDEQDDLDLDFLVLEVNNEKDLAYEEFKKACKLISQEVKNF